MASMLAMPRKLASASANGTAGYVAKVTTIRRAAAVAVSRGELAMVRAADGTVIVGCSDGTAGPLRRWTGTDRAATTNANAAPTPTSVVRVARLTTPP